MVKETVGREQPRLMLENGPGRHARSNTNSTIVEEGAIGKANSGTALHIRPSDPLCR